ncbi:hypothetical protein GCM10025778_14930 [Paeniglutamicibacter antarcticus]|uniref:Uncharacterized protein n=1 Tax=Paeniglutamicibacter antarcticus TaxID=494023 RepID=A0ABP9TPQ2_9MICC
MSVSTLMLVLLVIGEDSFPEQVVTFLYASSATGFILTAGWWWLKDFEITLLPLDEDDTDQK